MQVVIGDVRIKDFNSMNLIIEKYELAYNPSLGKEAYTWRFKGYASNYTKALELIQRRELLVLPKSEELDEVLEQIKESNTTLLKELDKYAQRNNKS